MRFFNLQQLTGRTYCVLAVIILGIAAVCISAEPNTTAKSNYADIIRAAA